MPEVPPTVMAVLVRAALAVLGAALLYVAVCRLRWMTVETTLVRVRRAAEAQAAAGAVLLLTALLQPGWMPYAALAGGAAALAWQLATAHAWRGLPPAMRRRQAAAATQEAAASSAADKQPERWRA